PSACPPAPSSPRPPASSTPFPYTTLFRTSDVTLTRSLAWLGLFGIVQAFAVWGTTFVPIQQTYLPATVVQALYSVQTFLVATASALLLHFGSSLWADTVGHQAPLRRVATWLAPACFVLWTVFYAVYWVRVPEEPFRLIGAAEVLARYGMAIPGAAITCIALVLQAREFHLLRMDHLVAKLKRSEEHTSELQSRENLVCR